MHKKTPTYIYIYIYIYTAPSSKIDQPLKYPIIGPPLRWPTRQYCCKIHPTTQALQGHPIQYSFLYHKGFRYPHGIPAVAK